MRLLKKLHRIIFVPSNVIKLHRLDRKLWYDSDTRMVEAMFEILCEYVENELAQTQLYAQNCSLWEKIKFEYTPRNRRYAWSRQLAMQHLDWEMKLDKGKCNQAKIAKQVKELYEWYRDEYCLMKDPYELYEDPEFMFIDSEGNPTKEMFVKNESGKAYTMNTFHPDYDELLRKLHAHELAVENMINSKLKTLLKIKNYLWT